jgi:hypothetical protein
MAKEPDAVTLQQTQALPPEYIEKLYKDIAANLYSVDEKTGEITGLLATSPLLGEQQYAIKTDAEGNELYDAEGNPIFDESRPLYEMENGEYTEDASLAATDQKGNPILAVKGGVSAPEVAALTKNQKEAIRMMAEEGIGIYEDYFDDAQGLYDKAEAAIDASTAMYDPLGQIQYDTKDVLDEEGNVIGQEKVAQMQDVYDEEGNVIGQEEVRKGGYKDFYDPFVEDVVDTTLADLYDIRLSEGNELMGQAASMGAFGGSRAAVADQELVRNYMREAGAQGSALRSEAFNTAMGYSTDAFENAMTRSANAGELFQGLGTATGALGEAEQAAFMRDVDALYNVGALEQTQQQKELDVQRAAEIEAAFEPYQRMGFLANFAAGLPMTESTMGMTSVPAPNPLADIYGTSTSLSAGQLGDVK